MAEPVLVLRPEPGAGQTALRLKGAGFLPIVYPLYGIEPVDWSPPDPAGVDALLVTSANALRQGGPGLARYFPKSVFVVGEATAEAARDAGFQSIHVGGGDAATTLPLLAQAGHRTILYLSGKEVRERSGHGLSITRIPVYRTVPLGDEEGMTRVMPRDRGAFALIHSPRAGARLSDLVSADERGRISIVAISNAASDACGTGWRGRVTAGQPTEQAMLAGLLMLV